MAADRDPECDRFVDIVVLAGNQLRYLFPDGKPTDDEVKNVARRVGLNATNKDFKDDLIVKVLLASAYVLDGTRKIKTIESIYKQIRHKSERDIYN